MGQLKHVSPQAMTASGRVQGLSGALVQVKISKMRKSGSSSQGVTGTHGKGPTMGAGGLGAGGDGGGGDGEDADEGGGGETVGEGGGGEVAGKGGGGEVAGGGEAGGGGDEPCCIIGGKIKQCAYG